MGQAVFQSRVMFAGIPMTARYRLYRGDEGLEMEFESVVTDAGDVVDIEFSVNDGAIGEEIERILRLRLSPIPLEAE